MITQAVRIAAIYHDTVIQATTIFVFGWIIVALIRGRK